jgi:sugar fermentation stimulation protein A
MTMRPNRAKAEGLIWPPLVKGTLIRRYRRFLADVALDDGRTVTAHCPNTGRMLTCCEAGRPVYLSTHDSPRRKLPYTWEMIAMPESLVGVNTLVPNRLVRKAADRQAIAELRGYGRARAEVRLPDRARLDLQLQHADGRLCFVEIKNCTLVRNGAALFPDAVTARGLKHLASLTHLTAAGHRAVMFFLVQRMDAAWIRPADEIDPAYGRGLREAQRKGVEILAYDVHIDLQGIRLHRALPCRL